MTQVQGKFVALPPVYEAIQWDGTLDGSLEIFDFINERTVQKGSVGPIKFETRVLGKDDPSFEAVIFLERTIIREDEDNLRKMWPTMWLVNCPRPYGWEIMNDDRFKLNYGEVDEDA